MISLIVIAKNEEKNLERCINSVKKIADEIIIIDTGSLDRTKEIAKKFTDKIFDFEWIDDFSAAKNFAIDKANEDWILFLDADETISEKDLDKIKKLTGKEAYGFSFIQRNYKNSTGLFSSVSCIGDEYEESRIAPCYVPRRMIRLFVNDRRIRFEGKVHENVEPSILRIGAIEDSEIPIHHFGSLNETPEKIRKYVEIEKKEINGNYLKAFEVGVQLHEIGELDEAVRYLNMSLNLNDKFYFSWLELGVIFLKAGELDKAEETLKTAEKLGKHEMIYFHLGVLHGLKKDYDIALDYFKKALEMNNKNADTFFNLSLTYSNLGIKEEARKMLEKAKLLNPLYNNYNFE